MVTGAALLGSGFHLGYSFARRLIQQTPGIARIPANPLKPRTPAVHVTEMTDEEAIRAEKNDAQGILKKLIQPSAKALEDNEQSE